MDKKERAELLDKSMVEMQRSRDAVSLAFIVLRKILDDYREVENLAGMLFALRDLLNMLLKDQPLEQ